MEAVSVGVYVTGSSIYWQALRRDASGEVAILPIEVENPIRLPPKTMTTADLAAAQEQLQTIFQTANPAAVILKEVDAFHSDGVDLGMRKAIVILAAHHSGILFEELSMPKINKRVRPGTTYSSKGTSGELEKHVHNHFPGLKDPQMKATAAAWAGLAPQK